MNGKLSWRIFWALIGVFVIVLGIMVILPPLLVHRIYLLILLPFIAVFFLLGIALLVLTLREKVSGTLRKFFLLTGASAIGIPVGILLHNLVYGLFIYFFGEGFWNGGDEPFFFIMATIVCPLGFLVGAIGSIVLRIREARSR